MQIGDQAPNELGKDQNGKQLFLSDFKGKKLVLYFYPKDLTPGCTMQACNLRDNLEKLKEKNLTVIGVSADNENKHQKFIEKYSLPFTLIADNDRQLINAFGVWGPKKFMGKTYDGIHRTTFIIDENGKINHVIAKPKTKNHAEEILKLI